MKDEGSWHVGNVFGSLEHAEQAREKITKILLPVHQEHTAPCMATPLLRLV